ncbi:Hypothetical protein PHPALM_8726 [Phytophthora palmivora]|uniref:DDE-1 domain-containing protein n=1 Tax=Phytophthora palmivora TaxID=4796 RepID=A0A2P4Y952_9STRA|nr:Hypothetical protein PHPALM_8726 [Phytophthora palmivora]
MKRIERSYIIRLKRVALALVEEVGIEETSYQLNIARGTVHGWTKQVDSIHEFKGSAKSKTLKARDAKKYFLARVESILSTAGIIEFMWRIHPQWVTAYLAVKVNGELAHGPTYGSTKPQAAETTYEELDEVRATFSLDFWISGGILNVDETAVLFDMPPRNSWAGNGRKDFARILGANKHAGRMTLTVRDNGTKLLILFILRGVSGDTIENSKFETYRKEGQGLVAVEANATVVLLLLNSTAVCQPLNVGVMRPLKAKLRHSAKCTGSSAKEKRLRAIQSTIAAWGTISHSSVNSWLHESYSAVPWDDCLKQVVFYVLSYDL